MFSYLPLQFKCMIFHSSFVKFLHHLVVCYELTEWPAPSWLYSSVGRALHRYGRGHGLESFKAGIFLSFHNRVWKGIFAILDLTKIQFRNRENDKYLDRIRDFTAPRGAGLARQNLGMGYGIFRLFVGNSGNRHDPNKLSSGQSRWYLHSNQTIECACNQRVFCFAADARKVHVV